MARNPKVVAAYSAMANLGIHVSKVKPVLKKLLKLYDKNWELIEEENYRALADAIFEEDENQVPEPEPEQVQKKKSKRHDEGGINDEDGHLHNEPVRPLKRSRLRGQETQALHALTGPGSSSAPYPLKIPKLEDGTVPESSSELQRQSTSGGNARNETHQLPPRDGVVDKGKQPVSPQTTYRRRRVTSERAPPAVPLIIPKDEPIDDMPGYEVPLAVILPEQPSGRDFSMSNGAAEKQDGHATAALRCRGGEVGGKGVLPTSREEAASNNEMASSGVGGVNAAEKQDGHDTLALHCRDGEGGGEDILPSSHEEAASNVDIGLSTAGVVNAAEMLDGHDTVPLRCRDVEVGGEDVLPSSHEEAASNVEIAQSAMGGEGSVMITPTVNVSMEPEEFEPLLVEGNKDSGMTCILNGSINVMSSAALVAPQIPGSQPCLSGLDDGEPASKKVGTNDFVEFDDGKELVDVVCPNSPSLTLDPKHLPTTEIRISQDVDLTKGEEIVSVSWVNNTTKESPPPFHYLRRSAAFRDAYVKISLSCIGNDDCCSTCMGNCILSSKPCFCANKTGGEFAYTVQGLLKEEFLKDCIAISHHPQNFFYCKDCPLERSMSDGCIEPCKGHLKRKFIKECWSKCGCGKHCGNRVVQRGITCKLEVFFTSEGKGWGLRTLEDLPKGAFVCEFVGEILTVQELHERKLKYPKTGKCTYPILLDANWDSGVVKDKEALCLDAGSYGNIARFINHRCFDANLVEIPVEVECPDHQYYHLAFFTSREIAAQEELTWDYGMNFDDNDQPIELFQCRCGSKFCRNMKRANRSTRSPIAR